MELWVTALAALVVIEATILLTPRGVSHWKFATILSLVVGAVQAATVWVIHQRQRAARASTIREMQMMLNDIINNQLTVIQTAAGLRDGESAQAQAAFAAITRSVTAITEALQHISDDTLREWHFKYAHRSRPVE